MNLEHHTEQMEAARAQFNRIWQQRIQPAMNELELIPSSREELIQHCCWIAFTEALAPQLGVPAIDVIYHQKTKP